MSRTLAHYIDKADRTVISAQFWDPKPFEGNLARVSSPVTGKVGVIDRDGHVVIDFCYDYIDPFFQGVARVNVGGRMENGLVSGGRFGFVSRDGTEVVVPEYEGAREADDGRITVVKDGWYGFLDLQGNVIVEPRFEFAGWHAGGLAVVSVDGADGYVDRDGEWVIEPRFEEATAFVDGLARVRLDGRWGIINREGVLVHDAVYERIGTLAGGACWAVKDSKCGVLDAAGGIVGDHWFDEIRQVGEAGIWPVRKNDDWGFLRPDGSIVAMGLQGALPFSDGLARAKRDDRWGFVDTRGDLVIPCRYTDAWPFAERRAAVKGETGWRFVDPDGKELGPKNLAFGNRFREGLAPVQIHGEWGFLALDGTVSIAPCYSWVGYFSEGLAPAMLVDDETVPIAADRTDAHVLPAGGLTHPVFETTDADSHIIAIIGFRRYLDDRESELLAKLIQAWERGVYCTGKLYCEDKWVSPFNIYVRVQNLLDPLGAVSLLVSELFTAGLPITELLYARWGTPPGQTVMQPNADPRMPTNVRAVFDDFSDYWRAVWQADGPTPAPENYYYLRGALQDAEGKLTLEERHTPIWFPDVKVCMGVLQGHGEEYGEPTERSRRVAAAIDAAIERRFANVWIKPGTERRFPTPATRDGSPGVEHISYEGRTGYACAFQCGVLLHWFSQSRMRFREPELMEALREVVLELELEPVILWNRFQQPLPMLPMGRPTVLVVNLWAAPPTAPKVVGSANLIEKP